MSKFATFAGMISILVVACAELPRDSDLIKDPNTAIRIAQDGCVSPKVDIRQTGTWHAELRNGYWQVWVDGHGGACRHQMDTKVRASDGKLDDACVECVS